MVAEKQQFFEEKVKTVLLFSAKYIIRTIILWEF
jgi:hypothetical protein